MKELAFNGLGFLVVVVLFLAIIALLTFLSKKSWKKKDRKESTENSETPAEKKEWRKKGLRILAVIALWTMFNLVLWMMIPIAWESWFYSKGLFFFGSQIATVTLLVVLIVFKNETNKTAINFTSLAILSVLLIGFWNQATTGGFNNNGSYNSSNHNDLKKGGSLISWISSFDMNDTHTAPTGVYGEWIPVVPGETCFAKNGSIGMQAKLSSGKLSRPIYENKGRNHPLPAGTTNLRFVSLGTTSVAIYCQKS